MKRIISIALYRIMTIAACAPYEKSESMSDNTAVEILSKNELTSLPKPDIYSDGKTKLIKTANYRFEVDNVKKSTEAITSALTKFPAYISSSSLHLENPILENRMTIRVQNEYFHELLTEIDAQARFVNFRDVNTQDASKEFVDLESRLKTKREVEARYMAILRDRAGTIEELLDAERQIGSLHEEIEATISRINHLKEQVSYSTINLEFYQTVNQELTASSNVPVKDRFQTALESGWSAVVSILVGLVYIWPLVALALIALLVVRLRFAKKLV